MLATITDHDAVIALLAEEGFTASGLDAKTWEHADGLVLVQLMAMPWGRVVAIKPTLRAGQDVEVWRPWSVELTGPVSLDVLRVNLRALTGWGE